MTTPKVSVLIPVYNTARFLRKCFDSLVAQTLTDIEFVVVNDGSTDCSLAICREYAARDSRFKVISQTNSGSAVARQTALSSAAGEFVIVCDSDDWADPKLYETLYDKAMATKADITICGHYREYDRGTVQWKPQYKEHNGYVDPDDFILREHCCSWSMLIKRSFIDNNNITYDPRVSLGEDRLLNYKLTMCKPRIVQVQQCLYHYRRRKGEESYTNSICHASIDQLRVMHDWIKESFTGHARQQLIHESALNLAFACLRSADTDSNYLRRFSDTELKWHHIRRMPKSLKWLIVASSKIIPVQAVRLAVKTAYPLVYK